MSITDRLNLPDSPGSAAVLAYLTAQEQKDFSTASSFFSADIHFHGLVLDAQGIPQISAAMTEFLPMVDHLTVEAATQCEANDERERFLVLY